MSAVVARWKCRRSPSPTARPDWYRALFATHALTVVDIGTGSGKWVLEVADEFPTARVIGLDLSPIQPTYVARNAEFIVEDVNEGMGFSDASTDLVHSRCPLLRHCLIQVTSRRHHRDTVAPLSPRNTPNIGPPRWLGPTNRTRIPLCHVQQRHSPPQLGTKRGTDPRPTGPKNRWPNSCKKTSGRSAGF